MPEGIDDLAQRGDRAADAAGSAFGYVANIGGLVHSKASPEQDGRLYHAVGTGGGTGQYLSPTEIFMSETVVQYAVMQAINWANGFTALRLLAVPFSAWAVANARWYLALLLFGIAVATDLLDGMAARRFGNASSFGGFFDHATDCAFVTATLGGMAAAGWVPWLLVALIPSAFAQYTLDSGVLSGSGLRGNLLGKCNGLGYFVLAGAIIGRQAFGLDWLPVLLIDALAWTLVATTLASMGERLLYLLKKQR